MKLEDFTKEELIAAFRQSMFYDERELLVYALNARRERCFGLYEVERRIADDYLQEHIAFLKEHEGQDMTRLPFTELEKARNGLDTYELHNKKAENHYRRSMQCYEQVNQLLARKKKK